MPREDLPKDMLQLLRPQQVRSYALAKGWQRIPNVGGGIALFSHPGADLDQLLVPMDETFLDYSRRLRDVVETLADFEHRPVEEVLNDLIVSESDIVRFRVASPATERGSIPLQEGIRLLEGAKRSLLAAAHSVLSPSIHHPRMGRAEAQQLLSKCHLGQTERGSFGVSISCPLRAVEPDQPLVVGVETFTRKAISTMMRSLNRLVQSIEADVVPQVFEAIDDQPVLSANLCDALMQMQPPEDDSHLDVAVSWASTLPPLLQIPSSVRIRHEYFAIIEDVAKKLRPAQEPAASLFVGHIETLGGEPSPDGRMQGEATLSVMFDEQLQAARVDLSPEEWQIAHTALGAHSVVKLKGTLHRGTRIHRITEISELTCLQ